MSPKRIKFRAGATLAEVAAYAARHQCRVDVSYAVHRGRVIPVATAHDQQELNGEASGPVPSLTQRQAS